ncbi:MAG TPA: histidine kinase [Steroidobacteraceae bacterium]
MAGQLRQRDILSTYACLLLVAAIGARAAYAGFFEVRQFEDPVSWAVRWSAGYLVFLGAYIAACRTNGTHHRRRVIGLLVTQAAVALFLVWVYPSFVATFLLLVVAWQIGWLAPLRVALLAALFLAVSLAAIKCAGESRSLSFLLLFMSCGFQAFAISAAHLARNEALARDELARVNAELRATQALMADNARVAERLRISRDLHDILGHCLTTLTIHLDVAGRLTNSQAAEHVQCARDVAGALLAEVRTVVNRVRVEPVDLRSVLLALTERVVGVKIRLILPDELRALDPARADALIRCVQEVITNTIRHAKAKELVVEVDEAPDGSIKINTSDDGRGGPFVEGGGLAGMRERFKLLGGELSIAAPPGGGFRVRGAIPAVGALS